MAVLLVGLVVAAGYWVATDPLFRIARISVASSGRVSPVWARERLRRLEGRHVLAVSLAEFEAALEGHPWLRGVEIAKRLPSGVDVTILEKQPVAILRAEDRLFFLDRGGRPIAPYEADLGSGDYVVVESDPAATESILEALQLAEGWSRKGGSWAAGLSEIVVADASSFRLVVAGLEFPLLVDRDSLDRVGNFESILPEIQSRFPDLEMADLRFPGQIVFQPAAVPPMEG